VCGESRKKRKKNNKYLNIYKAIEQQIWEGSFIENPKKEQREFRERLPGLQGHLKKRAVYLPILNPVKLLIQHDQEKGVSGPLQPENPSKEERQKTFSTRRGLTTNSEKGGVRN